MMASCRQRLMTSAALTGLAACFALAADAPVDPLLKLRGEWRSQVQKETKSLRDQYAARLQQLEKDLAAKGDYTGASKARKERLDIMAGLAPAEVSAGNPPAAIESGQPVTLSANSARLSGGVTYDSKQGILTGWSAVGAAASWLLPPGLKGGGYEVELTWSCSPDAGGELLLKEDFYTLRRPVKASSSWDVYQTDIIGTLRLLTNSRLLELSAAVVKGTGLLQLKSIRLLPAASQK